MNIAQASHTKNEYESIYSKERKNVGIKPILLILTKFPTELWILKFRFDVEICSLFQLIPAFYFNGNERENAFEPFLLARQMFNSSSSS